MSTERDYNVTIRETSKDMTAKERIMIKDTTNCVSIDAITAEQGTLIIDFSYYAILDIHNERSDNKDYQKIVVVDSAGVKYATGSDSFIRSLVSIVDEMYEAGEPVENIQLEVTRKESKNYKGKTFISVSLI